MEMTEAIKICQSDSEWHEIARELISSDGRCRRLLMFRSLLKPYRYYVKLEEQHPDRRGKITWYQTSTIAEYINNTPD